MANNSTINNEKEKRQVVAVFTLTVLKEILNDQVMANKIGEDTSDHIYATLKHYVGEMGWI